VLVGIRDSQAVRDLICAAQLAPAYSGHDAAPATAKHLLTRSAATADAASLGGPPRGGGNGRSYRRPPGCVSRAAERLDEYVAAVITARLATPDAADLLTPRGSEPDLPDLLAGAAIGVVYGAVSGLVLVKLLRPMPAADSTAGTTSSSDT
jgi:hypothetical protein